MSFEEVISHCLNDNWPLVNQIFLKDENLQESFIAYAMSNSRFLLRMVWRRNVSTLDYLTSVAKRHSIDHRNLDTILASYGLHKTSNFFEDITYYCLNDDCSMVKCMIEKNEDLGRSFVAYATQDVDFILRMVRKKNISTMEYLHSRSSQSDFTMLNLILISYGLKPFDTSDEVMKEVEDITFHLRDKGRSKL